jgi:hypothetical protein
MGMARVLYHGHLILFNMKTRGMQLGRECVKGKSDQNLQRFP